MVVILVGNLTAKALIFIKVRQPGGFRKIHLIYHLHFVSFMQRQALVNWPEWNELDTTSGLSIVEISRQSCVTQNRTRVQAGRSSFRWRKWMLWKKQRRSNFELTLNFFCQFLILLKKFVSPMYADYGIMVNGIDRLM